jgi:hypothetical protein
MKSNVILEILKKLTEYEEYLNEASTTSTVGGTYKPPIRPGIRKWFNKNLMPFIDPVSDYIDAEINYDSLDGHVKKSKKEISKREKLAKHIRNKDYKQDSADEGDDEYAYAPFKMHKPDYQVDSVNESKKETNEDLGVWFGTKKKPKGSKQPKGPWVNICSKKDGKHPPCGRPEGDTKGYPKCRAVGVAAKMTDSQKQSACQQKRKAEKKDTQTGKGQKPVMTSYKPKKKKTNESVLISLIRKSLS